MFKFLKISTCIFIGILFCKNDFAQTISYLDSSQKGVSFRGLSVVTNDVFWISGSKGTVGKTIDGGQHFTWVKPKSFEKTDFRDIEAFDEKTAIIMGIDSPGVILKTKDGGANWKVVYRSNEHGIFLDAMAFKNNKRGVCVGDPIDSHFWLIETDDGGDSWRKAKDYDCPWAAEGEACFASSGTNIQFVDVPHFEYGFVSGGVKAHLFLLGGNKKNPIQFSTNLEIIQGVQTTGANSLAINKDYYVVVGGDFQKPKLSTKNYVYIGDFEKQLHANNHPLNGYKSCVIFKDSNTLIATGLSGTDVTISSMEDWKHFSDEPFHVVQKAKNGQAIYLAGGNGRIAKIIF